MRTFLHTPFDHIPARPGDALGLAARIASLPSRLLRAPVEALDRRRRERQADAELSALDSHLLADIGLRRAPADHWQPINTSCG
jgi:uncharacterized protein YjiS (DUF1127 family)